MKTILNFLFSVLKFIFVGIFKIAWWIISKLAIALHWLWKQYPELFTIPLIIWIFYQVSNYIYSIDPMASRLDTSTFLVPIFAIFNVLLFLSISWIIMGLLFSTARNFLANNLKKTFTGLTKWQKVKYSTGVLFGLLYSLVLLSLVIA